VTAGATGDHLTQLGGNISLRAVDGAPASRPEVLLPATWREASGGYIDLRDRRDDGTAAAPVVPAWLEGLASWHSAQRQALAVSADAAVVLLAAAYWTRSATAALAGAAAFVAGGLCSGLWKPRASVEAQGACWILRPALVALAAMVGALAATATPLATAAAIGGTCLGALAAARMAAWQVLGASRRRGIGLRAALVVGDESWAEQIRHRMAVFPEAGLRYAGSVAVSEADADPAAVAAAAERLGAEHVLFAGSSPACLRRVTHLLGGTDCSVVVALKGAGTGARVGDVSLLPLHLDPGWGALLAKRALDVLLSSLILALVGPLLVVTTLAIRIEDGGPALFRQKRVGRGGRTFTCYKFRSMIVGAEKLREDLDSENMANGLLFKLRADPRITRVGRVIRRLSVDELPQLLNVLKGDMSLVGPRPLPVSPDDFTVDAHDRHLVPPGITGLWQVHGTNALAYPDMLDLDFSYLATRTLALDLTLIARTVPALLVRRSPG
jgi:lipopolysaccharide/colanic/teichoic acid biosynthesis glycosyltransferase